MQFDFSFKQMDSSPALQAYAEQKITDKIRKFVTKPIAVHVTFSVDRHEHTAACVVRGGDGFNIEVTHTCGDMYGSVDRTVDKLEVQLKRHKEKLKGHKKKKTINLVAVDGEAAEGDPVDAEDIVKYEESRRRVIAR